MRIFKNLKFSAAAYYLRNRTENGCPHGVVSHDRHASSQRSESAHRGLCKGVQQRYTSASGASRPANVKQAAQSTFEFNPYELQPESENCSRMT